MSDARQFEESQESQDEPTTPKGPRVKTESAGPRTPTPKQPGTRLPKSPGSPVRGLYARHKGEAPSKSRSQNVTAQYGSDVPSLT
ncbi:hypothetical protein DL93DRAFT_2092080 [Clavulina sp. PMI_390]|nr:hypothetical protein DL93DRAFT_2092080 [Clavulina sp. PMI_390]